MSMKGWMRRLARANKGAVLLETAFAVLFLMAIVIGIGAVAVQGQDLESRGRVAREVGDYVRLYVEEVGTLDAQGVEHADEMARVRLRALPEDHRTIITHIGRNAETGMYEQRAVWRLGAYEVDATSELVNSPAPQPGIHAQDEVLTLDLGEEVLVVESIVRFTGIPKGSREASPRRTWAITTMP